MFYEKKVMLPNHGWYVSRVVQGGDVAEGMRRLKRGVEDFGENQGTYR